MVDRRDSPADRAGLLRAFLARIISSNRRIPELVAGCLSRSWMNSLNTRHVLNMVSKCTDLFDRFVVTGSLTLGIPHHSGILLLVMGAASDERVHVKCIHLAIGPLVFRRAAQVFPVRVQKAREASNERRSNALGVECLRADDRDDAQAAVMAEAAASPALVKTITLGLVFADGAQGRRLGTLPVETVSFNPNRCLSVLHGVYRHVWHDG